MSKHRKSDRIPPAKDRITLSMIEEQYGRPIVDVARDFGISTTIFKAICRGKGISRWPHRQIRSINRSIDALKEQTKLAEGQELSKIQTDIFDLETKKSLVTTATSCNVNAHTRKSIFNVDMERVDKDCFKKLVQLLKGASPSTRSKEETYPATKNYDNAGDNEVIQSEPSKTPNSQEPGDESQNHGVQTDRVTTLLRTPPQVNNQLVPSACPQNNATATLGITDHLSFQQQHRNMNVPPLAPPDQPVLLLHPLPSTQTHTINSLAPATHSLYFSYPTVFSWHPQTQVTPNHHVSFSNLPALHYQPPIHYQPSSIIAHQPSHQFILPFSNTPLRTTPQPPSLATHLPTDSHEKTMVGSKRERNFHGDDGKQLSNPGVKKTKLNLNATYC